MNYLTIYYWKIIAWDSHRINTTSPTWHFTTKSSGGGGGGGGGTPPTPPLNKKPIADLGAGEPYQGLIKTAILFNGSRSYDPDGNITKWLWVFGDNTNGTGKTISHNYLKAGTYNVTLTVTDNNRTTNTDTTTCVITQPNRSPTKPIITGTKNGPKNNNYTYTALSTDADNDPIKYIFDWGDPLSLNQSSGFLPNGTSFTASHSWATAGRYDITVTVTDNKNQSSSKITVYIDAIKTGDIGYLIDNNGDGIYDGFYSEVSKQITTVQKKDGNYNIDSDGNGVWVYTFNAANRLISYQQPNTPGFEIIPGISAIAFVFLWRRKRNGND
jgi:PKD repeat protein